MIRLDYKDIFEIRYAVHMTVFHVLPVFLIALLSVLIIFRVTRLTHVPLRVSMERLLNKSSANAAGNGLTSSFASVTSASASATMALAAVMRRSKGHDRNFQPTVILVLVSMSYGLLYIPLLKHFVRHVISVKNASSRATPITPAPSTSPVSHSTSSSTRSTEECLVNRLHVTIWVIILPQSRAGFTHHF